MIVSYIMDLRKMVGHRPLIMPCACVILENEEGKILLQKRADDGRWGYHGGAVEPDERVEDAARREVKEELGLALGELRLFGIYSGPEFHHIYPNGDESSPIDIVYLCNSFSGTLELQEEEVAEVGWFGENDLPEPLSRNCRKAIQDYYSGKREQKEI